MGWDVSEPQTQHPDLSGTESVYLCWQAQPGWILSAHPSGYSRSRIHFLSIASLTLIFLFKIYFPRSLPRNHGSAGAVSPRPCPGPIHLIIHPGHIPSEEEQKSRVLAYKIFGCFTRGMNCEKLCSPLYIFKSASKNVHYRFK